MKKIIKETQVAEMKSIDTDYAWKDQPHEIDDIINYLIDAKHEGATHIKIGGDVDYSDRTIECIEITPLIVEEETDEEYNKRLQDEESRKLAKQNIEKAKERTLYEELKLKYDK